MSSITTKFISNLWHNMPTRGYIHFSIQTGHKLPTLPQDSFKRANIRRLMPLATDPIQTTQLKATAARPKAPKLPPKTQAPKPVAKTQALNSANPVKKTTQTVQRNIPKIKTQTQTVNNPSSKKLQGASSNTQRTKPPKLYEGNSNQLLKIFKRKIFITDQSNAISKSVVRFLDAELASDFARLLKSEIKSGKISSDRVKQYILENRLDAARLEQKNPDISLFWQQVSDEFMPTNKTDKTAFKKALLASSPPVPTRLQQPLTQVVEEGEPAVLVMNKTRNHFKVPFMPMGNH